MRKKEKPKMEKDQVTISLTVKLIKLLRERKPDHQSRSSYTESLIWMGLQQEEISIKNRQNNGN